MTLCYAEITPPYPIADDSYFFFNVVYGDIFDPILAGVLWLIMLLNLLLLPKLSSLDFCSDGLSFEFLNNGESSLFDFISDFLAGLVYVLL